jgi:hypothetical protein
MIRTEFSPALRKASSRRLFAHRREAAKSVKHVSQSPQPKFFGNGRLREASIVPNLLGRLVSKPSSFHEVAQVEADNHAAWRVALALQVFVAFGHVHLSKFSAGAIDFSQERDFDPAVRAVVQRGRNIFGSVRIELSLAGSLCVILAAVRVTAQNAGPPAPPPGATPSAADTGAARRHACGR